MSPGRRCRALLTLALILTCRAAAAQSPQPDRTAEYRQWIAQMKQQPRGPFESVRWYCKDGAVLPPKPGACVEHGGGVQHGEWNAHARQLRANGYAIGNLLVTIDPQQLDREPALLQQLLVERFLIGYDDGWIFRGGRAYRGALQDDDERHAGRALLLALLQSPRSFLLAREAVRLIPHDADTPLLGRVRDLTAALDERDPAFHALRSRIHNDPQAADAQRVRAFAAKSVTDPDLRAAFEQLAATIDETFRPQPVPQALARFARQLRDARLAGELQQLAARTLVAADSAAQMSAAADTVAWLRNHLDEFRQPELKLAALDVSITAEAAVMVAGSRLLQNLEQASRRERLAWLDASAVSLYGAGLLDERELGEFRAQLAALPQGAMRLADYRDHLEYFDRLPGWCNRRIDYELGDGIERLAPLEPLARVYAADRVRGSPLLVYSQLLQTLRDDADTLAQASQSLFGKPAGAPMRRLNAGIARGILRTSAGAAGGSSEPAIYLVPATTSDLPPAAGILTEDEGNPLSHVQLLARNLGIPNVVIARALMPELTAHADRSVVVAASSGGRVQIADDGPSWDSILGPATQDAPATILVNLGKLDLSRTDFISTADLRAGDSGRIVGPKAAQVGELTRRFPQHVSAGLAVPFGVYRAFLDQPVRTGGPSMFAWMKQQYAEMAVQQRLDPDGYAARVPEFLSFVRDWIIAQPLAPAVRARLYDAMHDRFGMDGTYGVFVRSDTNVEDLPGFTGAGLNLTVPNVVRFDEVIAALRQVWASPFTERAFGWRQGLMDQPEHVYVSVLLHRSVPNEKSGVMITADVDSGDPSTLTVATSPGVGGSVDSEAAETLRIDMASGSARLLGSSTTRRQRVLLPEGGAKMIRADAPAAVLRPDEIAQLVAFARDLPTHYPELRDGDGKPAPADIEFGFVRGQLMLLQIRPFLQNRAAARQQYLAQLDAGLKSSGSRSVDLREAPAEHGS